MDPPSSVWNVADLTSLTHLHVWGGGTPTLTVGAASSSGQFLIQDGGLELHDARLGENAAVSHYTILDGEPLRGASFSPDGSELVFITGPEVDFEAIRQSQ